MTNLQNLTLAILLTSTSAIASIAPKAITNLHDAAEHNHVLEHDENHSHEIKTTEELGIYVSVQKMVEDREYEGSMKNYGNQQRREPFLGLPMRYPVFPHPGANNQIAVATTHNGRPIVLFGPQAAMKMGREFMGFTMQHEFAHHDLGHLSRYGNQNSATKEANADCRATKALLQYGMQHIVQHTARVQAGQGCRYNPNTPLHMVRESHPCGAQRARIIQNCASR
jgi:hypothetical protein